MKILLGTAAASLLLMALLVSTKFFFEDRLAPVESGIHGALRAQRADILLLGSSRTRQSYDVKLLESSTGRGVFAVAYNGLDPISMLPVLRTLLTRAAHRPQMLVVEGNCDRISHAPDVEDPRLFFDAPPPLKRELIANYLRTHDHDENTYLDLFSLLANRGNEFILTWPLVHRVLDNLSYHGGYVGKDVPGLDLATFSKLNLPIESDHPRPDEVAALRTIIELARASGVKIVLVDPPLPASVEAQPEIVALEHALQSFAAAEGVRYVRIASGFSSSDPLMFHDAIHLSTAGRTLYTRLFAASLPGLESDVAHR